MSISSDFRRTHQAGQKLSKAAGSITGGTSGLGLALMRELLGAARASLRRAHERGGAAVARENVGEHARRRCRSKEDIYPVACRSRELGGSTCRKTRRTWAGAAGDALRHSGRPGAGGFATNVLGPFRLTKALMGALAASAREGRGAVVLNISSDAAVNAYTGWGAYGASKAALHHLSRVWGEEHASDGVRFLSLDPGDMDTPMHAAAIPDADPSTLKAPEQAARELAAAIADALSSPSVKELEGAAL